MSRRLARDQGERQLGRSTNYAKAVTPSRKATQDDLPSYASTSKPFPEAEWRVREGAKMPVGEGAPDAPATTADNPDRRFLRRRRSAFYMRLRLIPSFASVNSDGPGLP